MADKFNVKKTVNAWTWRTAKLITVNSKNNDYQISDINRNLFSSNMKRLYDIDIPRLLKSNVSYAIEADRLINSGFVVLRIYTS